MANLPNVLDGNFETEVLKSTTPVLVDFSATWCGPCRALAPKLEELSQTYAGKVRFLQVDVDQAQATAQRYGVMNVPTLLVFQNGEVIGHMMGNQPTPEIAKLLDRALGQ